MAEIVFDPVLYPYVSPEILDQFPDQVQLGLSFGVPELGGAFFDSLLQLPVGLSLRFLGPFPVPDVPGDSLYAHDLSLLVPYGRCNHFKGNPFSPPVDDDHIVRRYYFALDGMPGQRCPSTPKTLYASSANNDSVSTMAMRIPPQVALSICEKIREENRSRPSDPQALQCRSCEACCGGRAMKSPARDRPCCQVRQRCARLVATAV